MFISICPAEVPLSKVPLTLQHHTHHLISEIRIENKTEENFSAEITVVSHYHQHDKIL